MIVFSLTKTHDENGTYIPMNKVDKIEVCDFEAFFKFIEKQISEVPEDTKKRDCPRFTPGIFGNNQRDTKHFLKTDLLVLDIDDIEDFKSFEKDMMALQDKKIAFLLFGSPSNSEKVSKYRLILPLEKSITDPKLYKRGYEATAKSILKMEGYTIDLKCKDAPHFFYIPPSIQKKTIIYNPGTPTKFIEEVEEKIKEEEDEIDIQRQDAFFLASAEEVMTNFQSIIDHLILKKTSITSTYEEWLAVGFACISLRNHYVSKKDAEKFFQQFSDLDKGQKYYAEHDEQIRQFNKWWDVSQDKFSIGTIYKYAIDAGWSFPRIYKKEVSLVCAHNDQKRFYITYPHTEADSIIPLYEPPFTPEIAAHTIKVAYPGKFQMQEEDIGYLDEDGKFKFLQTPAILTRNNTRYPPNYAFMLGQKRPGTYYDRKKDEVLMAKHAIASATPKYSQDIHNFLSQIDVDISLLYTYLYYVTDCTKALPWMYLYGESNTGKSFLALLIGSLFTSFPDKKFLSKDGNSFKGTAGDSPILWMDEYIPNDATTLKELVTSDRYVVDQKWKSMQSVHGFHRLISAVNSEEVNLPQDDKTDFSAMVRRVQTIKFKHKNKEYLEQIGGISTTRNWLSYEFKNHIAYIRENKESFNLIPPSSDILVLKPTSLQDGDASVYGASVEHKAILEFLVGYSLKTRKKTSLNAYILIEEVQRELIELRITQKRISESALKSVIKKAIRCPFQRRVDVRGANWAIPYDKIEELGERLGLV